MSIITNLKVINTKHFKNSRSTFTKSENILILAIKML